MAVEISGSGVVACPLCGDAVAPGRGCAMCHLSPQDMVRFAKRSGRWSEPWGGGVWSRFIGVVVYAGIVAWSWLLAPTTFLFVLPGAIVGAYMQTVRARPVFGAVLCAAIVIVVPALFWPSGLTGFLSALTQAR